MPHDLVEDHKSFRETTASAVRVDDGGNKFLQTICRVAQHYMASYTTGQLEPQVLHVYLTLR